MKGSVTLVCLFCALLPETLQAQELICSDGESEYLVGYKNGDEFIHVYSAGKTSSYRVDLIQENDSQHVVLGVSNDDSPRISLMFRPDIQASYWVENESVRTDACWMQ